MSTTDSLISARQNASPLLTKLLEAWALTDDFFDNRLPPGMFYEQPISLRNPFLFYLGHLPSFAINKYNELFSLPPLHPFFDVIFQRGIDPDVDNPTRCHAHPDYPTTWPAVSDVVAYRDEVRKAVLGSEERWCKLEESEVGEMVVEHEMMHVETLCYMLNQVDDVRKRTARAAMRVPVNGTKAAARHSNPSLQERTMEWVEVPGGEVVLGANRGSIKYGWDNEFGEEKVHVSAFRASVLPVTNGEFLEFVEGANGYESSELWREEDWAWRVKEGVDRPRCWYKKDGQWMYRTVTGDVPLQDVLELPVYVSLSEARAYAKWKNKRLPTEAEWQRAAYGTIDTDKLRAYPWGNEEPRPDVHGNFGFVHHKPVNVGSYPAGRSYWGLLDLVGNGWELTETLFGPLPGFAPSPLYPGYSADFFDGKHYVLKGASWVTHPSMIRPSFRNWYQAHYPYVFSKFRLVEDIVDGSSV